jgi:hypothetical protein
LTLSGTNNTYSGGTVLNAGSWSTALGTVVLCNGNVFGTGLLTLTNGNLQASTPVTITNPVAFANGTDTVGTSYVGFSGSPINFSNTGINMILGTANLIVNSNTNLNEVLFDGGGQRQRSLGGFVRMRGGGGRCVPCVVVLLTYVACGLSRQ